jgi:hypothetical protein
MLSIDVTAEREATSSIARLRLLTTAAATKTVTNDAICHHLLVEGRQQYYLVL